MHLMANQDQSLQRHRLKSVIAIATAASICLFSGACNSVRQPSATVSEVKAAVSGVTASSATIKWTTDQPLTSQVAFGPTPAYGSLSAFNAAPVTSHSVTLTGLAAGTTYHYAALSTNAKGQVSTSPNFTFSTTGASGAPSISGVTSGAITSNSATITWNSDQPLTSQVEYGPTTGYGSLSSFNSSPVTSHTVILTALTPGKTYNYVTLSTSSAGQITKSSNFTFTTVGAAGAPVISGLAAGEITGTSAVVTWTTDQPLTSQVEYGKSAAHGSLSAFVAVPLTSHLIKLTGLTPGTTYDFTALSTNSAGQVSKSPNMTFTTSSMGGSSQLSGVTAVGITMNSATITWITDQPSASQVEYGKTPAHGSLSAFIASPVTSHVVKLTGLLPGTNYDYQALSANASGQVGKSANLTFTTSATAGSSQISGVTSANITTTSATINWLTDQPSTSQVSYGTTPAYGSLSAFNASPVTSHSTIVTGLTPGTTYNFAVLSANSAGQVGKSPNFTLTTVSGPPVISSVTASAVSANSVTITWATDQPSSSQVEYGTTTTLRSLLHKRPPHNLRSDYGSALVRVHSVTLSGLAPGAIYDYAVSSKNSSGLENLSPNLSFTTLAARSAKDGAARPGTGATAGAVEARK